MSEVAAASTEAGGQSAEPAGEVRYGGFWARLGAWFVDGYIIWFISIAAITGMMLVFTGKFVIYTETGLVAIVVAMFYHAAFVSSSMRATPGKRVFGLYVTDDQGRQLGVGHALGRHLASALSWLTLGIGFLMIAYSDRKQALHDHKAGTVVRRRPGASMGGMVVAFGLVFILVFGVGLYHWVAKPAIFEYAVKQQMEELHRNMSANKVPIQDYAKKNRAWPTSWEQVESAGGKNPMRDLDEIGKVFVKNVSIEQDASMVAEIEILEKKGRLRMGPQRVGDRLGWNCNASSEILRYMPENCGPLQ